MPEPVIVKALFGDAALLRVTVVVPVVVDVVSVCAGTLSVIVPPFEFGDSVTATIPVPAIVTPVDPLVFDIICASDAPPTATPRAPSFVIRESLALIVRDPLLADTIIPLPATIVCMGAMSVRGIDIVFKIVLDLMSFTTKFKLPDATLIESIRVSVSTTDERGTAVHRLPLPCDES